MCNKHSLLNLILVFAVMLSCLAYTAQPAGPAKAAPLAADWTGWPYNLTLIVRNQATTSLPNAYTVTNNRHGESDQSGSVAVRL